MKEFSSFFSVENPKAIKARDYGYLNAINYMAPAELGGVGNLCPHSSAGCRALCLGWYSGQAGMVKRGTGKRVGESKVRACRKHKAEMFMKDRQAFMRLMFDGIEAAQRKAKRLGLKLCVRLNGATDIGWEGIRIEMPSRSGAKGFYLAGNIFELFPDIQFVDYTKSKRRMLNFCAGMMPPNYHLTFSRSEDNWDDCETVLASGGNVAVVFGCKMHEFPDTYHGYLVLDGDLHDLRHLDTINENRLTRSEGRIIGLSPKGPAARRDKSGFVVRL